MSSIGVESLIKKTFANHVFSNHGKKVATRTVKVNMYHTAPERHPTAAPTTTCFSVWYLQPEIATNDKYLSAQAQQRFPLSLLFFFGRGR